jgi:hypothetical protein
MIENRWSVAMSLPVSVPVPMDVRAPACVHARAQSPCFSFVFIFMYMQQGRARLYRSKGRIEVSVTIVKGVIPVYLGCSGLFRTRVQNTEIHFFASKKRPKQISFSKNNRLFRGYIQYPCH